jgi:trk system potassium uptake protein TrkH
MTLFVGDGVTAFSSVLATTGCVGPGLNQVGPLLNYAFIPDPGKWVLILCMLLGRLEFLAILALFLPSFWRR